MEECTMKKTLKILSWICAVVLIFGTVSVGMTAYAVSDDVIGSYDFEITNVYKDINWNNVTAYKSETHVHTVRSDADTEVDDMIHKYYELGFDAMALTDHGTVNYGWDHDQGRVAIFDYQAFVHGGIDNLSESDYKNIITGQRARSINSGKGMMELPLGNEMNGMSAIKCHINGYYADVSHGELGLAADWPTDRVKDNYNAGGFSHINHVGEWSEGNDDASVYSASWLSKFAKIYEDYCPNRGGRGAANQGTKGCIGMELVNTADSRTHNDRRFVYDEILKILAPKGINVFGFCEDDAHEYSDCDRNAQYFLINNDKDVKITSALFDASNNESGKTSDYKNNNSDPMDKVQNYYRDAMFYGEFYCSSKNSKNSYELGNGFNAVGSYPSVSNISVNQDKNQISITFKDATKARMVADGEVIETYRTSASEQTVVFDLNRNEDKINSYVRIYLTGNGGITYLQPFLVKKTESVKPTVQFITPTEDTEVVVKYANGSIVEDNRTFTNFYYTLLPGDYTYTASRRGYQTKTDIPFTVTQAEYDAGEHKKINVELEELTNVSYAYFYAPETIYVSPSDNKTFDKYIDRENAVNGALHADAQSTGNIYFHRENAENLRLEYSMVEGFAAESMTIGATSASGDTLSTSITAGRLATALANNQHSLIKWTLKYDYNGVPYEAYAYSYVYKPLTDSTSVVGAGGYAKTKKNILDWAHSEMYIAAAIYASGINKLEVVGTDSNHGYKFAPYSGYTFAEDQNTTVTGVGYWQKSDDSSGGSVDIEINNTDNAYIYADRSRINDWSQIPNFTLGFDLNKVTETTDKNNASNACARFLFDTTLTDAKNGTFDPTHILYDLEFSDQNNYTLKIDYNLNDSSVQSSNGSVSESLASFPAQRFYQSDSNNASKAFSHPLPAATAQESTVPVSAYIVGVKEGRHDGIALEINLTVVNTDKSSLRTELNDTIKNCLQKEWFATVEDWDNYQNTIQRASAVLGNPAAEVEEIENAKLELQDAFDSFVFKQGTMTIKHIWRYNGQEGIIQTETQSYDYGSDLSASALSITGYTYSNVYDCYAEGTAEINRLKYNATGDFDLEFGDRDSYEWRFYYTPNEYNVVYNSVGANAITSFEGKARYGIDYTVATEIPQKTGYTFGGWYLDNTMRNYSAGETFKWNYAGDGEFAAQWTANTYNVTYMLDEDDPTSEYNVSTSYKTATYGTSYSVTDSIPVKPGYNFLGWNLNGETQINEETGEEELRIHSAGTRTNWTTPADSVFYAQWEEADRTVTFNKNATDAVLTDNNGNPLSDSYAITVYYGEPYGTLPNATRAGYNVEWYADPNFSNSMKVTATTNVSIDADHTLFAKWIPINYTITYNLDGGSVGGNNPATYNVESGTITLINPVKTGYEFAGWSGSNGATPQKTVTIDAANTTGNKTYNANWTLGGYDITYNLNGGTNDANNPASYKVTDTVVLKAPTKLGYRFTGWTGDNGSSPETSVTIPAGTTGAKEYTANWALETYTITYDYDGAAAIASNPDSYSVETATFTLSNPTKTGYTFSRWIADEDHQTLTGKNVTITKGSVTGDITFKADWTENGAHDIEYRLNGGKVEGYNPATYKDGNTFTLVDPVRDGYTFAGWTKTVGSTSTSSNQILATDTTDLIFTANWTVVDYTITYNLNDGTVSTANPATYNAESAKITLNNPSKTGYTFAGWTGTGLTTASQVVEIPTGSTGNRTYTANWNLDGYRIIYNLDGGTAAGNPTAYNVASNAITLIDPVKPGYTFLGWTGTDISEATTGYTIPAGSTGDKTFNANWELTGYTITYNLNGGSFDGGIDPNPATYNFNSGAILLKNPTKAGYTFTGWEYNGVVSAQVTIPAGSTGNRTYTAIFEKSVYTISYAGIEGATITSNPTSYSVDSNAITLNNPSKTGYTFEGWVGSGLSGASKSVTIAKGSTGNKSYTATWTPLSYTITYNGIEGATISGNKTNPNAYTFETATFTLNAPAKTGAVFTGWTGDNGSSPEQTVTIPKGSTGNKTYTANWTYNDYTITYDLAGGTETTNPTTYKVTSADINLNAPVRTGYTFAGWTGTGLDSATANVKIPTGSTGNRNYKANWQAITYTITYILNGGQVASNANPKTYTVESSSIELVNPVKTGSVFAGWTGTELTEPTMTVTIPKGSISNRTYTATWTDNSYTITYTNIDGATFAGENRTTYNEVTNDFALINPTKRGYHFDGWSGTGISGSGISDSVTIPKGSSGNRSYKANWTLEEYTISYTLDGGTEGIGNPRTYTVNDAPFTLYAPVKTGFEFAGWNSDISAETEMSVTIDPSVTTGNINFIATWTSGSYVITLDTKGGTLPSGQASTINYTYDSATITIQNPTKTGYTFAGWTGTGLTSATASLVIPQHSTGDRSYVANWVSSNENNITYNLNGGKVEGTNPETYETDSGLITLIKPTKDGYKFNGWAVDNDANGIVTPSTGGKSVAIDTTTGGSAILSATWTPSSYKITYNLNGGTATNPPSYTIETAAFTLSNPVREGYTFGGWIGTDIDATAPNSRVTIAAATGNRTYTAVWTEKNYAITYNYNGGSTSEPNPTSYSIVTPTFTLSNPVKTGYTFTGWSGTDISGTAKVVTIQTGSTGARSYTANFTSETYTITYSGVEDTSAYPATYTVDSENISIPNPTKDGYEFLGWKHDGSLDPEKNLVIAKGSTGNKSFAAQWAEVEYTITYNLDGGSVSGTNPETYNIESADIKLVNPTKAGYTFTGWTGTGITGSSSSVTIAKGSTGDRTYTATWDVAPFTISYTGIPADAVAAQNLPTGYTAAEAKAIPNAIMAGYTFEGWTGTGLSSATKNLVLPAGTTGNKTFKATWKIVEYSLEIDYDGGEPTVTVPDTFTIDSEDIILSAPKKAGYTFTGWTGSDLSALTLEVKIPRGSTGNKTYTANWTERTGNTHKIYFRGYQNVPLYVDITKDANGVVTEHRDYIEVEIGKPISNGFYSNPETIDTTAGYKITGWNIDVNQPEYMNLDDDITVYAKWEIDPVEYTVQVNGTEAYTTTGTQFEKVTVTTAYQNASGQLFSHWIAKEVDDNGNAISESEVTSYYRNYSFFAHANVVLTAVYGESTTVRATTRITKIEDYDPNYDWFTPNSERSVATELTLAQHGIIFTADSSIGSSDSGFVLNKSGVYNGVAKTKGLTGTWALSIPNPYMFGTDNTIYIRSYVTVIDEDGSKTTKYSAIRTYLNNQDKTDG